MSDNGDFALRLPRPGRGLKLVLVLVGLFAIAGAIVVQSTPGGEEGRRLFELLAFEPHRLISSGGVPRIWTLFTAGLLTSTDGVGHAIGSLIGLYFMSPDLERRWGSARLLRFLAASVVIGNLVVFAASFLPYEPFKPPMVYGPLAAIAATAVAWARENKNATARFMFFVPMTGRTFFWLVIALCAVALLSSGFHEGSFAPLGGALAGVLLAGSPSPLRAAWLRIRLGSLRARGAGKQITVSELLDETPRPRPATKRAGGKTPALRILQGGLEDDLKNRKPPKDKRYLN
ncbi:MAG: rhomboid family intramembrane serine protease [Labilithrix sp.]|nr:rhomboid family intramembrane serine protease [Labilithrix sp.]MCW5813590.1 rhomboid family intramembrane serine protease [Labilithrix sp.]